MNEGYYFCFSTKLEKFIICWYDGVGVFTTTGSDRELYEKDFDIVCADPIPYPGVTSYPGVIELGNLMHQQKRRKFNWFRIFVTIIISLTTIWSAMWLTLVLYDIFYNTHKDLYHDFIMLSSTVNSLLAMSYAYLYFKKEKHE